MKIAFLSPFYPYRGGIAQFSDSLFVELKKEHDIRAFTFERQYPSMLFPGKTQLVSKDDIDRGVNAERILDSINPFNWNAAAKKISLFNPELMLMSYWMPFFAPSFGKAAKKLRRTGTKIISILHNVVPHEKRFGDIALTKYFFRQNDGFIILNEASRKDLLRISPDAKFIVHPHPLYDHYGEHIDRNEACKRLNISPDKKNILFFGFIRDYKGLDILIEAMKSLDDSYRLIIAGECYGSFEKYQKQIDENNLSEKIIPHIRYIEEKEIPAFFSASDVCILPYRSATQSGIVGIAYHFDLPVIATAVGGLAEMIEGNSTGLIVHSPKASDIASTIQSYFKDNLKQNFIPNIRNYKSQHSWRNLAEQIISLYNSIR